MENKLNLKLFLGALALSLVLLAAYEWYWYNEGHRPGFDINAEIWSYWRGKVEDLTADDVVIVGSSRAHFDINIHLFDSLTGHRPVMLAVPGGSPYYVAEDVIRASDFRGLLIIGVAPTLFYVTGSDGWALQTKAGMVDFYHSQTYASKFSQAVYEYIDPHLSYLDTDISFKNLLTRLSLPDRPGVFHAPAWPPMVSMDRYRNIRMNPGMETDSVLQKRQTTIWDSFGWVNPYQDSIDVILDHYVSLVKEFESKGGRVAFIQPPVKGKYLEQEPVLYPREKYWNILLERAGVNGYNYADYPEMRAMNPPEWSHLNRKEADQYTRMLVTLLKQDGLLKP